MLQETLTNIPETGEKKKKKENLNGKIKDIKNNQMITWELNVSIN